MLQASQISQNKVNVAAGVNTAFNHKFPYQQQYSASGFSPIPNPLQQINSPQQTWQPGQIQKPANFPVMQQHNGASPPQQQALNVAGNQQQQQRNEATLPLWETAAAPSQQNNVAGSSNQNTAVQSQQGSQAAHVPQHFGNQQPIGGQQQANPPIAANANQAAKYPFMPPGFFLKHGGQRNAHPVESAIHTSRTVTRNVLKKATDDMDGSGVISGESQIVSGSGSDLDDISSSFE